MGFVITNILFAIIIAYLIYDVIYSIKELDDTFKMTFASCAATIAIVLFISFAIAAKQSIAMQAIDDYFNGKIEVTEQIDTTRTFKFN